MSKIKSYDVGSMPFIGEFDKFSRGAIIFDSILPLLHGMGHPSYEPVRYFEERVIKGFLDKLEAGINVPNYPQFRDMNIMFLDSIDGIEKSENGYFMVKSLSLRSEMAKIPEVQAIKRNSRTIYEKLGSPFKIKICITGPYTLSSLFLDRRIGIFRELSGVLLKFVSGNIHKDKYSKVELIAIDEPAFGFLSDPLIDYGTEGREELLKAWENIFHEAISRGVSSCLHLHNTADELFWEIKSLNIIESHAEDPIYESKRVKQLLEKKDKFLKASICITDFDRLIREKILAESHLDEATLMQRVEKAWAGIKQGIIDPKDFLESVETMKKRLKKIVDNYGIERVPYAGPECGMRSFPNYECALEYLKRVSYIIKDFAQA
ncbi:MAG: hypothetical protein H3Z52_01085 [archaeon]|nr:hypothetical protein [archaeon]